MSRFTNYIPTAKLQWVTPDAENTIVSLARVSANPTESPRSGDGLLRYLASNNHWSPFEMAHLCVEIYAPRDITHQLVRHWSMRFQEFSGRYSEYGENAFTLRECRTQHATNRQMSDVSDDQELIDYWTEAQQAVLALSVKTYREALARGIAKEQARNVLPEGMVMSRVFVTASARSWITYFKARQTGSGAQGEHAELAETIAKIFREHFPVTSAAFAI